MNPSTWREEAEQHLKSNGGRSRAAPEEIERDIARTREAITEDIRALEQKLTPAQLAEQAKGMARDVKDSAIEQMRDVKERTVERISESAHQLGDTATRVGRGTMSFAAANAVPLSLLGLGASVLLLSTLRRRRQRDLALARPPDWRSEGGYRVGEFEAEQPAGGMVERAREVKEELQEKAHEIAGEVRSRVHEAGQQMELIPERTRAMVQRARTRAAQAGTSARDTFVRASNQSRETVSAHPLAFVLGSLALGAGSALLLANLARPGGSGFFARLAEQLRTQTRRMFGQRRAATYRFEGGDRGLPGEADERLMAGAI